jgi:hypothetical protein
MRHKNPPFNHLAMALAATGLLLALACAGCVHRTSDEMTKAVVSGAKKVYMAGSEDFFAGSSVAKVTVSRGVGRGLRGGGSGGGPGTGDTARDEEQRRTFRDYTEGDSGTLNSQLGSPLPPVTLHLILTNRGPGTITVTIDDFESDLGNFALDPEVLVIAPGQTAEPTPMVSELGVSSDTIDFKVTLSSGSIRETHTVVAVDVLDAPGKPPDAAQ